MGHRVWGMGVIMGHGLCASSRSCCNEEGQGEGQGERQGEGRGQGRGSGRATPQRVPLAWGMAS